MIRCHRIRRRGPAVLALAGVTACSLAFPLPAPVVKTKASRPFPCRHHACGCRDAEACWRDCCCFTAAEKVAWARRHGVAPPQFLLAAADRESSASTCRRACCRAAAQADAAQEIAQTPPPAGDGVVLMILALRCRGVHLSVTLLPPSLPAEPPAISHRDVERFVALPAALSRYVPPYLAVATPPPDAAAA
jgi:hypothetical protein